MITKLFRGRHRAPGLISIVVAIMTIVALPATPAFADSNPARLQIKAATGAQHLVDQATGRCLDSNSKGAVGTNPCNSGNYQNWIRSFDIMELDVQTGLCLQTNLQGSEIFTAVCDKNNAYQWWLTSNGTIENFESGPNLCLDSNSRGNVYEINCNGGAYQKWNFVSS